MPNPTKFDWISYPSASSNAPVTYHIRLPNEAASGDTIIISGQFGTNTDQITAIADDQGGSLAGGQWVKDAFQGTADNQGIIIASRINVPAGTRAVTLTIASGNGFQQYEGLLVNNIASRDGTSVKRSTSGTSISAGNITVSSNSFQVTKAALTSLSAHSTPTRFTAPSNFALWGPNGCDDTCCMYGTTASGGTINPALAVSRSWGTTAAAIMSYNTGTSGAAASVKARVQFEMNLCLNDPAGNFTPTGAAMTFDCPSQSDTNALSVAFDDGPAQWGSDGASAVAKISSSPANTWSGSGITQAGGTKAGIEFLYATTAATSATGAITLGTWASPPDGTSNGFSFRVTGMANVRSFDKVQKGSGTLSSVPPVTETTALNSALVTAENDELVLIWSQEERQTPTNFTASTGTAKIIMPDSGVYDGNSGIHDSGMAVQEIAVAGTSVNYDITWSDYEGGLTVEEWCIQAIAFTSLPPPSRPMFRGHS